MVPKLKAKRYQIIGVFLYHGPQCSGSPAFTAAAITPTTDATSAAVATAATTAKSISIASGGLPTRPTRPGLGAPKARGPPRLRGPKVWGPQGSPAQWPQRAGAHKAWKSPRVGAPRIAGPHGLGALWVRGTQGLRAPMGLGPQRVSGRVYETKPIIVVFCFLWYHFVQRMLS
jgi:hypothetical protein